MGARYAIFNNYRDVTAGVHSSASLGKFCMALYGNDWLLRACVALVCCRILLYSEDEVKVQLLMQKRDPRTERGLRYVCAERDACGELGKSLVISRLLSLPCSALCSLFRPPMLLARAKSMDACKLTSPSQTSFGSRIPFLHQKTG